MATIVYGDSHATSGHATGLSIIGPSLSGSTLQRVDVWLAGTASAVATVSATGQTHGAYTAAGANPQQADSNNWTMYTFYKVITSAETVNVAWTGSRDYLVCVSTRTGMDTSTPVDTTGGDTSLTRVVSSGSVTPSTAGTTADVVIGMRNSTHGVTWSPESGLSEQDKVNTGSDPNRHVWIGFGRPAAEATSYDIEASSSGFSAAITLVLFAASTTSTVPSGATWSNVSTDADDWNTRLRDPLNWLMSVPRISTLKSANQSISNTTHTAVNFEVEDDKTSFTHSTSSSTWKHTANTAGLYMVYTNIQFDIGTVAGQRWVDLYQNAASDGTGGTWIASQNMPQPASGVVSRLSVSGVVELDAGDWVSAVVYQSSGSSLNVQGASSTFGALFLAKQA